MKRYRDQFPIFNSYNLLRSSGIAVCCPSCGGEALAKRDDGACVVRCLRCHRVIRRSYEKDVYAAKGLCIACERWMRIPLESARAQTTEARVACPYCGTIQSVAVGCVGSTGVNPLADMALYYQSSYRGEVFWALNREHLNYLIDYIGADLRERVFYQDKRGQGYILKAGEAHKLPKFMLKSKNRAGIIKVLLKMRDK